MRVPIALALTLLAGCASAPPPASVPPVALRHRLDEPALANLHSAYGLIPPTPRITPDQAVLTALAFNPALASTAATAARDRADAALAAQRPNPQISFTPDRIVSTIAGGSPWTLALALAWPVMHPGESAARKAVGAATQEAVRLDLAQAGWKTRSEAVDALRAVLVTRAAETAAETLAASAAELRAASDRLFAAGQSNRAERALVLDAAARSAADVPVRRGARTAAESRLTTALGLTPGTNLDPDWPGWRTPPAPDVGAPDRLAEMAIFNRLDLQASLARLRAADAAYAQTDAAKYGDVNVSPGYTYDKGDHRLQFGVTAELPINHGPQVKMEAATAARDAAVAQTQALQAVLLAGVSSASADYSARYAAWAAWAPIIANARADAERAARALHAGDGDRPALLAAQSRLHAAELGELDALTAVLTAMAGLEDAVQRPIWPASKLGALDKVPHATPQGDR